MSASGTSLPARSRQARASALPPDEFTDRAAIVAAKSRGQVAGVHAGLSGNVAQAPGFGAAIAEQLAHVPQPPRHNRLASRLPVTDTEQLERQAFDDQGRRRVELLELIEKPQRQGSSRGRHGSQMAGPETTPSLPIRGPSPA